MTKKLKKYLSIDQRKTTTLDRLREYMALGGTKKLNAKDELVLSRLDEINQLLRKGYSTGTCAKKIENDYSISQAHAYKLIRDCLELYGDAQESSKQGKKYILEEMYMTGALKAMQMNDLHAYAHFLDSIARMNGLFDTNAITFNMNQLQMTKIVFADSSLETLKQEMEKDSVIDIDG